MGAERRGGDYQREQEKKSLAGCGAVRSVKKDHFG